MSELPLILHVLYRFDTGGLENGVVNLINRLPGYRHAVLALEHCAPAFCARVQRPDVEFISLHKPPGQGLKMAPRFVRELRRLRPALVHTRNLAALEMQLPAWWVGGAARLHSEHGWGSEDPQGLARGPQRLRRLFRPFVQQYVALSGELERYLIDRVGIAPERVQRICNGVDTERFTPVAARAPIAGSPFNDPAHFVVGCVGRMQEVKGQTVLVDAFIAACRRAPASPLRLVLVGEGPQRAVCAEKLQQAGLQDRAWLAGERADVPALMQGFDAFVLPSLAEGISNTVLEAMASGLPVLATRVGGNAELVEHGHSGQLVMPGDVAALADGLLDGLANPAAARAAGRAGRLRAERLFSLPVMVGAYDALYRGLLARQRRA